MDDENHKQTDHLNSSPIESTGHRTQLPESTNKNKKPTTKVTALLFVLLVIIIAGGVFWYLRDEKVKPLPKPIPPNSETETTSTNLTGYTIYQVPKQLGDLNFFANTIPYFGTSCTGSATTNCPPAVASSDISYYQIGVTPSGEPIIAAADYKIGVGSFYFVALETKTNNYEIFGKFSGLDSSVSADSTSIASLNQSLSSNVTLNTTDLIPALEFPQNAIINGTSLTLPSGYSGPSGYFIDGLTGLRQLQFDQQLSSADITKIGSSGGIDFYVVTAENQSDYQVKELYGVIGGAYASAYLPVDPLSSSSAPGIAWTQNTPDSQPVSNTNTYTSAAAGCGSAYGYVIAKNIDPSQLVKAGVGPASETIYQLPTSSSLFSDYYTNNYGGGSGLQDSTLQNLSLSDFQADHAVILAKNSLGEYVVYQRTDMFEGGGCGKPVIYLYPEAPTDVNVKIGADVTASDPTYGQDGWNDVLALPGGKLIYQDKSYNSLFWEGIGLGSYPQINSGTVVPSAAAVSTIKKQLSEQGFSGSEISDFLAYWQPKLPNTPYVRLTWFNTSQMNQLAPLDITPKPTTLIRTFLDFQGLEKPISLSPQTFHAPERQGFTVVEWGGLLRTN